MGDDSKTFTSAGLLPCVAAASAAMTGRPAFQASICLVAALVLAPVWLGALPRFLGGPTVTVVGLLAAVWGVALSVLDDSRGLDISLMRSETFTVLAFVGAVGLLLWARTALGVARTAVCFGFGGLLNLGLIGLNPVNPWKYDIALPLAILLLGAGWIARSRVAELIAVTLVAGVSAVSDSRSMTSFLALTGAVVVWQMRPPTHGGRARPWLSLASLAIFGTAAYSLLQTLFLEGALGPAAQQRSQAQLDATGSLITGGRPELGAATSLIQRQPWGYGSGTVPSSADVWSAKAGMSELNYDPNNGYVEIFMFGGHFEVHSVLGDMWIRFGPPGAFFLLLIVGWGIYALARSISIRSASAVAVLLGVLGAWDTFFSPLASSYRTLALLFALTAIPATVRATSSLTERHALT